MKSYVTAKFGGRERRFQLTIEGVGRLETVCGSGIGEIYQRLAMLQFRLRDITETIKNGLMGDGLAEDVATDMVADAIEKFRPATYLQLACDIMTACLYGIEQAQLVADRLQSEEKKQTGEGDLMRPATSPRTTGRRARQA